MKPDDIPPLQVENQCSRTGDDNLSGDSEAYKVSRREFVGTVGAITGGAALRLPNSGIKDIVDVAFPDSDPDANKVTVRLTVNGNAREFSLDPRVTLLDLLHETMGLTGTKKGCDHGQCGACTVLVNDMRINSCLTLAAMHDGDRITTIEGLAHGDELHPLQQAFLEHDGLQCGYCTPGQICSGIGLLAEVQKGYASMVTQDLSASGPFHLSDAEIRERMSGNICRCGAYPGIFQAVQSQVALAEKKPKGSA